MELLSRNPWANAALKKISPLDQWPERTLHTKSVGGRGEGVGREGRGGIGLLFLFL